MESERSNQNKLLKEIGLYYTVVDFTDSANDDAKNRWNFFKKKNHLRISI
jgi:hypothetical protein